MMDKDTKPQGDISTVRFVERALSPSEIEQLWEMYQLEREVCRGDSDDG